ncbi:MAG: hypothetical protein AAGG01_15730 [Planctomycetota bacterium]
MPWIQILAPVFLAAPAVLPLQEQVASTPEEPIKLAPLELKALADEIGEMARLDQLHRSAVQWGTTDPAELARLDALDDDATMAEWIRRNREGIELPKEVRDELMVKQNVLDKANVIRLGEIIRAHGYPDPKRLGVDFPSVAPILIHAQLEDYWLIQPQLLVEVKAGRMNPKAYAATYDRKLQHAGKIQLYGTGLAIDVKTGKKLPPLIEDIEVTNRARKEIGLEPLGNHRTPPHSGDK